MAILDATNVHKYDFNHEESTCPDCGAHGQYIPPSEEINDRVISKFECENGHKFSKTYYPKGHNND